jgi:hypothetical protein
MAKSSKAVAKRPRGRPPVYGQYHARQILEGLRKGDTLHQICQRPGMPSDELVVEWSIGEKRAPLPDFSEKYAQARLAQVERWAEQVLELSDESMKASGDMALLGAYKLRVDSRKWLLSKLRPGTYGDRLAVSGNGLGNCSISIYLPSKIQPRVTGHALMRLR